ncbi:FKBP-type peptidyl-prolyl cis-trans isomerase [Desertivirga brevis]|uniref:FKBP-type peptidyl-prolyl cis-trans isomerase n=1 Tax=Desertivirga brevis TaxID=2810310 RepID=UPI001F6109B4|nr:FKBP-type peptidyl-prolyl cis-trans isomerase [Pedobacter sp. SYSU D00873]
MKKFLGFAVMLLLIIGGCKKSEPYDFEKQLAIDEGLIKKFLSDNNLTAQRDTSGIYYIISAPGSGTVRYTANTSVTVKYKLHLLNGTEIPQGTGPVSFALGGVIDGWKIGIPKIQPGGKIRLLIPSGYAYGPNPTGGIPANSVLDFDIELLGVN